MTMAQVLEAARAEFRKLERPSTRPTSGRDAPAAGASARPHPSRDRTGPFSRGGARSERAQHGR